MIQARGQLNLSKKALAAERFGEIGMQQFDRDFPIVLEIVGQVDGGHPARAKPAVEAIAIGERFDHCNGASTWRGYFGEP
jgi:ribosomal protein S1